MKETYRENMAEETLKRTYTRLTKEQILQIPSLVREGHKHKDIALKWGVHERAINYWVRRLREVGHIVKAKKGTRKILLDIVD